MSVVAQVAPPFGAPFALPLVESADGESAATMAAAQPGVQRVRLLGRGRTTRGSAWTRETRRSVVVRRSGGDPPPGPSGRDEIRALPDCIERSGALAPEFMARLDIDVPAIRHRAGRTKRQEEGPRPAEGPVSSLPPGGAGAARRARPGS